MTGCCGEHGCVDSHERTRPAATRAQRVKIVHFLGIGRLPKRPMVDATGGTERSALEIARIQTRRGHDVTVASKGDEAWEGSWQGVRLLHLKPYSWIKSLSFGKVTGPHLPLLALIHGGRFDIVHLHEHLNTKFFGGRPRVMHFHNDPLADRSAADFAAAAPGYWARVSASGVQIAVSEFVVGRLNMAHEQAGVDAPPANIVKLSGGVNADALAPAKRKEARDRIRKSLGLKESDVLFLFAGALRPEKGVDYLARAFAKLSEEYPSACLAIAGGTKLWIEKGWLGGKALEDTEKHVRDILAPAIARKRAFMLGIVPPLEIDGYYSASDVFVLPSMFQETFGLVLLEAFAAGLPALTFKSGGIPELVETGKNGIVVPQGDENALCQGMRELLQSPDMRDRFGLAGKNVAAKYSWENTVDRLEAIYAGVMRR